MIYRMVKKFNLFAVILFFSIIPVIFSVFIVYLGYRIIGIPESTPSFVLSVIVPSIISPLTSYFFLNLIIKLHKSEEKLKEINVKLENALNDVKKLTGILPICASCKKIRDDDGYWSQVEEYLSKKTDVLFSHALCPVCYEAESRKIDKILKEREQEDE